MQIFDKHFGKIISIVLLIIILGLNSLGLELSDLKPFLIFSEILFFILIIIFFILQYYFYSKSKIFFKIVFLCLLFSLQAIFISKFINLVEIQNIDSSISEKNAAISLSWIIVVPVLFVSYILLGVIFDYIKSRRNNVL